MCPNRAVDEEESVQYVLVGQEAYQVQKERERRNVTTSASASGRLQT